MVFAVISIKVFWTILDFVLVIFLKRTTFKKFIFNIIYIVFGVTGL